MAAVQHNLRDMFYTQLFLQSSRLQGRRKLSIEVRGSMNYGAEWSEPPDSYIVLVCAHP